MGEFAKRANAVLKVAEASGTPVDWKTTADEQLARLRTHVPTSADVSTAKSLEMLTKLRELAYQLGYNAKLGLSAPVKPNLVVDRPVTASIELPKEAQEKQALVEGLTDPVKAWAQGVSGDISEKIKRRTASRMKVTDNPMTNPTFLPVAAIALPKAFREGAQDAVKSVRTEAATALDSELEAAKKEFEDALQAEYIGRKKIASAGELIDGLASSLLEKKADGEMATAANVYLALAALMGYGSHEAAKKWVEKRDTGRQDQKLLYRAMQQKAIDQGVPVYVDYKSLPAGQEAKPTVAELPDSVPEVEEPAVANLGLETEKTAAKRYADASDVVRTGPINVPSAAVEKAKDAMLPKLTGKVPDKLLKRFGNSTLARRVMSALKGVV
jgi:hypothetical protein